jgi:hypothetical protein
VQHLPGDRGSTNVAAKPPSFPGCPTKGHACIEQSVDKLKRFKRIALRCETNASSDGPFVAPTGPFILVESIHSA